MIFDGNEQFLKISKTKLDCNQYKGSICLDHKPYSFQTSKLKYISDKMIRKSSSFTYKNSEENFNNHFLFSSKTCPNISGSILAYVVGGFVGSKSQMNNNNHNLLYDLSAVISNILNSSRNEKDKTSLKKNENFCARTPENFQKSCNDFIVNESSQGKEKMRNVINDVVDFSHYIDVPVQNFIDKEKEMCSYNENHDSLLVSANFKLQCSDTVNIFEVFGEVCNDQSSEDNSLEDVCMEIARVESLAESEHQKNLTEDVSDTESLIEKSEPSSNKKIDEAIKNLLKSPISLLNPNSVNECDNNKSKKNDCYDLVREKSVCAQSSDHSPNFLATERFRQQSECSVESTDSESFIVFEEHCSWDGDKNKICYTCDEDSESAIFSEDDYSSDEEEKEVDSDSGFNCENYDLIECCVLEPDEKTKNNLKNYNDENHCKGKILKKVRFNDNIKINKIVAWDHAYRIARIGPWEQLARDRFRFQERIASLSKIISPVLSTKHRTKIYNNLYS